MTAFADRRAFHLLPLRFEALKAQAEANVDARRRKLAAKLHAEELALQQELVANQVTPEERRAALEKRAVDLVRRREEERATGEAPVRREEEEKRCAAGGLSLTRGGSPLHIEVHQQRAEGDSAPPPEQSRPKRS